MIGLILLYISASTTRYGMPRASSSTDSCGNFTHVSTTHFQEFAQLEAANGRLMAIIGTRNKTPTAVSSSTESRAKALMGQWCRLSMGR
ncbi:hypothetical protein V8C34DRAFT_133592 [Trichoderma compactum]